MIEVGPESVFKGESVFVKYWNELRPAKVIKVARKRIRVEIETKGGYTIGSWRDKVYKNGDGSQRPLEDFVESEVN